LLGQTRLAVIDEVKKIRIVSGRLNIAMSGGGGGSSSGAGSNSTDDEIQGPAL